MDVVLSELETRVLYGLYVFNLLNPNQIFVPVMSVEGQMGITASVYDVLVSNQFIVEHPLIKILVDENHKVLNNPVFRQMYNFFAAVKDGTAYGYNVEPLGIEWLNKEGILLANADHLEIVYQHIADHKTTTND